jgi:multiple sugar transport system permease protein
VGLENYKTVLNDKVFITSLFNTINYMLAIVPLVIVISLFLAVLLNEKIKLRGFFRSAFYLPYVVSPVAMGVIAIQLFSKKNFIVQVLEKLGLEQVSWNTTSPYAFWLIVIVTVWSQIGFFMVLYLNGLQNIPQELYEAAQIDGANRWKLFTYITLPQLRATSVLVIFMGILSTLQIFDQPYVISSAGQSMPGSPGDTTLSMVMYIYTRAFRYREMGPASAAAFIVFGMIFIASLLQNKIAKKESDE